MSAWRREALAFLPEFRSLIEPADSVMAAWVELFPGRFEDAVKAGDDDLIRRFFRYAWWCVETAAIEATDASTAAVVVFYEEVLDIPGVAERLPLYLPRDQFEELMPSFRSWTSEENYRRACESYDVARCD